MKEFSRKRFIIGFLVGSIGGIFFIGGMNISTVLFSILIGIVVGLMYGKFGYFVF